METSSSEFVPQPEQGEWQFFIVFLSNFALLIRFVKGVCFPAPFAKKIDNRYNVLGFHPQVSTY